MQEFVKRMGKGGGDVIQPEHLTCIKKSVSCKKNTVMTPRRGKSLSGEGKISRSAFKFKIRVFSAEVPGFDFSFPLLVNISFQNFSHKKNMLQYKIERFNPFYEAFGIKHGIYILYRLSKK